MIIRQIISLTHEGRIKNTRLKVRSYVGFLICLSFMFFISACGNTGTSGRDFSQSSTTTTLRGEPVTTTTVPARYRVNGTVNNLIHGSVVLRLNAQESITVSAGTTHFQFATQLGGGDAYSVEIQNQPVGPALVCVLTNASGSVSNGHINNVVLDCPTLQSVQITSAATAIHPDSSLSLSAFAVYAGGVNREITSFGDWVSADETIATVSSDGIVTAHSAGSVQIEKEFAGLRAQILITVKNTTLSELVINPLSLTLAPLASRQLQVTGIYSDSSTQDLTSRVSWSSSDPARASVSAQGVLTGVSAGSVSVGASLGVVSASRNYTISNATLSRIEVTPGFVSSAIGFIRQLRANAIYSDHSSVDITSDVIWSSQDPAVVQISSGGVLTTLAHGVTSVMASYQNQSVQFPVLVQNKNITAVEIVTEHQNFPVDSHQSLKAIAHFSDATTEDVTYSVQWYSDNASAIYVSDFSVDKGFARALSVGTANISVSYGSFSDSEQLQTSAATLDDLRLSPGDHLVSRGIDIKFKAYGLFSDMNEYEMTRTVSWSSSNVNLAEVSNSVGTQGWMYNKHVGANTVSVNVLAQHGAVSGQSALIITPATLSSISVHPAALTLAPLSAYQLRAIGDFSDGASSDLTQLVSWSSDNLTLAGVSSADGFQGLLSTLAVGTPTVSASLASRTGTKQINISEFDPAEVEEEGVGLKGEYYANRVLNVADYKGSRIDGTINFGWGAGAAPLGVGDNFSIRWTGFVKALTTEAYTFCTRSDDGIRVWVNGVSVINNWTDHAETENCGNINLVAGQKYSIQVEFYENGGSAVVRLFWQTPTIARQIVPRSVLFDQ